MISEYRNSDFQISGFAISNRKNIQQGFMPLYTRDKLTDTLHSVCGFETDFQFITKSQMKTIQKKVRVGNKLPYFKTRAKGEIG